MTRISLRRGASARALGFLALCLAGVLGFASMAYASGPSVPGVVTGHVQNSIGGPLAGVVVEVHGETTDTVLGNFTQRAVTDAGGDFVITDIVQGTYSMWVNGPNESHYETGYAEVYPWGLDELNWPPTFDTRRFVMGGTTETAGTITLANNGVVNGRAMDGATPIQGSEVVARIMAGGVQYMRWATTGADGRFSIPDALAGDWSLTYRGAGQYVPEDALPGSFAMDYDPVTVSPAQTFTVAAGATVNLTPYEFNVGELVTTGAFEEYAGNSYNIGSIGVAAAPSADPTDWEHTYYWMLGDNGWGHVYLPPGTWDVTYSDGDLPSYNSQTISSVVTVVGGAAEYLQRTLVPAANTYAIVGTLRESGTGTNLTAWVTASKIDPGSPWLEYYRKVPSTGIGLGTYLIRLPKSTGFTGNKMKVAWSDQATAPDEPFVHVTQEATITPPAGTLITQNKSMVVGGSISGTIHDSDGNLVPGVTVSVVRKAFDPSFGAIAWTGADNWWTRTDIDGNYSIGGLPADTDYKVNVYPDYNPGLALPIKYRDYNRRTYKNQPLVDSLNTLVAAPVSDHTAVSVSPVGHVETGIDETITPGGYVALHADGPDHPTGAVYCDVMYQYKSHWFEIDSGYTTGGTFEKIRKVLPAGHYKLIYTDYFKRGGGTWEFDLAGGEHKYASVLVPAPATVMSGSFLLKGSFAGLLGGGSGLSGGGPGDTLLKFAQLPSVLPTWSPLPLNTVTGGKIYEATLAGGSAAGIWTLTLPYDPAIVDADVPYLRVIHYKLGGGTETLSPIGWNTINHTIMVQTSSLSPFRVVYRKHTVKLGTPVTSTSTWRRYTRHTVYGSLSPKHTPRVTSVKLMVYRKNSRGHYVWYKNVAAPNYTYRTGTRYGATFSLKAGSYHIYAYAYNDRWHLATRSATYKYVRVR